MLRLKQYLSNLPSWVWNRYFITGMAFLVWMLFFDKNNILFNKSELISELSSLRQQIEFYSTKAREVEKEQNELLTPSEAVEKFAREKYWMKKDNEDLFIIVEE